MKIKSENNEALAKRAFFLAYQASRVVGMGIHAAIDDATPDSVLDGLAVSINGDETTLYADYVHGRMMKMRITIKDGHIEMRDDPLDPEYQSFVRKYPDYKDLFITAAKELELKIEIK